MKASVIAILMLLHLALGGRLPSEHSALVSRNATTPEIGNGVVQWTLNPSIVDANCSGTYATTISVQYANEEFALSKSCADVYNFLGGAKGKKDADLTFICKGTQPKGTGTDDNKIKVVIFMQGSSLGDENANGMQWWNVGMQCTDLSSNKVVFSQAVLGLKASDDHDGLTVTTVYCQAK